MTPTDLMPIARLDELAEDSPAHAEADGIDLVLVRRGPQVHVFEGRCPHRGALLADGRVEGPNLVCGVHGWDYRLDTGVSAYNPAERIYKFSCHMALNSDASVTRLKGPPHPINSLTDRATVIAALAAVDPVTAGQQVPGHRLSIQQLPLRVRPSLHPSILPVEEQTYSAVS